LLQLNIPSSQYGPSSLQSSIPLSQYGLSSLQSNIPRNEEIPNKETTTTTTTTIPTESSSFKMQSLSPIQPINYYSLRVVELKEILKNRKLPGGGTQVLTLNIIFTNTINSIKSTSFTTKYSVICNQIFILII